MSLVLYPSYDNQTREQIEAHISVLRSKRMSAAVEYELGRQAKIEHEQEKIQKRITSNYDRLKKYIENADKAIEKLEEQLAKCEMLRGELGLMTDLNV